MRKLIFKNVYSYFPCFFKRHLPLFIYESEKQVREDANDYENPSVELITFQKVGMFKYVVAWKIVGYLKEGE